jgi:hypothetical protein
MAFEERKCEMEVQENFPQGTKASKNAAESKESLDNNVVTLITVAQKPQTDQAQMVSNQNLLDPPRRNGTPPTPRSDGSSHQECSSAKESLDTPGVNDEILEAPASDLPTPSSSNPLHDESSLTQDAIDTEEGEDLVTKNQIKVTEATLNSGTPVKDSFRGEDDVQALSEMMQVLEVTSREHSTTNDLAAPDTFPSNVCDTFPSNVSDDVTDPVTPDEVAPKVMEMLQEVTPMVYNLAAAPAAGSAPAVSTVFTDSSDRFYDPEN